MFLSIAIFAQDDSLFGPNDILLYDGGETINTYFFVDSLFIGTPPDDDPDWIGEPNNLPSERVVIVENPFPLENETDKAGEWTRPAGGYVSLYLRYDKNIDFSKHPYFQIQIMPVFKEAPSSTSLGISVRNDKGEVSAMQQYRSGIPIDQWSTLVFDLRKMTKDARYNVIEIQINNGTTDDGSSMTETRPTKYLLDQIGFKAAKEGEVIPAAVFYENFKGYDGDWANGKYEGQICNDVGPASVYKNTVGFYSDMDYNWKLPSGEIGNVFIVQWSGNEGTNYDDYSGNARLTLNPTEELNDDNTPKGAGPGHFYISNIDISNYKDLVFSFGFAIYSWWPWGDGHPSARPGVEVSVDGGAFTELYTDSEFMISLGMGIPGSWTTQEEPFYEDRIFKLIEYPISATVAPESAKKMTIRVAYKAGHQSQVIDDLFLGGTIINETGLSEVKTAKVAIYPNPATSFVKVEGASQLNIYSISGTLMRQASEAQADVANLPPGLYLVKATINGEDFNLKFIKR
jgi:hypothetical protein